MTAGRCTICKRRTVDAFSIPAWLWDHMLRHLLAGRMDCGGDCHDCMVRIEGWLEEDPS